ncbi:MAG TPA: FliH/SctL family protein [Novosphingobium sp.]|nr:FliH/SctL family protein [Novosphingobium sp.]
MSDLGFQIPAPRLSLADALAGPSGFRADVRYGALPLLEPAPAPRAQAKDEPEAPHPVEEAFTQGFAAGYEQAQGESRAKAEEEAAARKGLALSLQRLDATLEEELRMRLRETVAALCEAAVAPLALDEEALVRRIDAAVSMLARADDDRVIRLHPEDIRQIAPRLAAEWQVEADSSLERGTIRIETINGGVEDGPATWRIAIAEALQRC